MPKLIVNADDFGFSPSTNQGIIHAHKVGIVTSTTVMVNLDYAESGLEELLQVAPNIGIGLHINLTQGKPVLPSSQVSTLVDEDGYFYPETKLLEVAFGYEGDELYQEIAAQIERLTHLIGHPPTHLDSHFHVAFLHPLALEATLTLAKEYGNLPMREIPLDAPSEQLVQGIQHFIPNLPTESLMHIIPMLKATLENHPVLMPTRFESGFNGNHTTLGDLLNILVNLPENRPTELLCHPGLANDPLNSKAEARQKEVDILTHPTVREVVERYNIELISYANL